VRADGGSTARGWAAGVLTFGVVLAGLWAVGPFHIPSDSMRDTLLPGDYVLVARWAYGVRLPGTGLWPRPPRAPRRGDLVVFRTADRPGEDVVKRCIAVAGQTVEIRDRRVVVDGDTLREPYARHSDATVHARDYDARDNFGPVTLERGEVFVLGDNREDSEDSRFLGPVREEDVVGRALLVYWSWDGARGRPRWERLLRRVH